MRNSMNDRKTGNWFYAVLKTVVSVFANLAAYIMCRPEMTGNWFEKP